MKIPRFLQTFISFFSSCIYISPTSNPPTASPSQSAIIAIEPPPQDRTSSPSPPPATSPDHLWTPPADVSEEDLTKLITSLETRLNLLQQEGGSSSLPADSNSDSWQKFTSDIPGFLERLNKRTEVTVIEGVMRGIVFPLLKDTLEGVGSLHWALFGFSLLAWGLEQIDKQHKNYRDCIDLLEDALFLLKDTKNKWDSDLIQSNLSRIVEVTYEVSIISASCCSNPRSKIKRIVEKLSSYFGADTLEASIKEAKEQLLKLQQQNNAVRQSLETKFTRMTSYHTIDKHSPLGRDAQAAEVQQILEKDYKQEIVAVCLHGMGGVGKSTLALHVFDTLLPRFKSCRVELPLVVENQENELPRFQKLILGDLNGRQNSEILDMLSGKEMLAKEFKQHKNPILIYIDNLERPDHLEKLLPKAEHFPQGFRLLVTTRNAKVSNSIRQLGVDRNRCHSMEVKTLEEHDSRSLLRKEALINSNMNNKDEIIEKNPSIKALEGEVLRLCCGLPLALKLMGRYIAWSQEQGGAESEGTWRYVVEAMRKGESVTGDSKDELYRTLRVSIDALEEPLKRDFLDLVTLNLMDIFRDVYEKVLEFFGDERNAFMKYEKERGRQVVESVLMKERLQILLDRHLLEENSEGKIVCHDVIRSLVKSIAQSSDDDNKKELRIISASKMQVDNGELKLDILVEDEIEKIVCLKTAIADIQVLSRMKQLRYAIIEIAVMRDNNEEDVVSEINFPKLKALHIYANSKEEKDAVLRPIVKLKRCPELRVLTVHGNLLDWQSTFYATNLKYLNLRNCHSLPSFPPPNSSLGTSLQTLRIQNCRSLLVISDTFQNFTSLTSIRWKNLPIMSLPQSMRCLSCLQRLHLSSCHNLKELPDAMFQNMGSSLLQLHLSNSKNLETLPEGISVLTSLTELDLSGCESMEFLPEGMGCLSSLQMLDLRSCHKLKELRDAMFQNMGSSLLQLHLSNCKNLETLPEGISVLTSLIELDLSGCESMDSLPEGMACLSSLHRLDLRSCHNLKELPDAMFQNMGNSLLQLHLSNCKNLETLPEGISMLTSLTELDMSGCESMEFLPEAMGCLSSLQMLDLRSCHNLKELPDPMFQNMGSSLLQLHLSNCKNLETLPEGILMLTSLIELDLSGCESMDSLPKAMGCLSSLQRLDLRSCYKLKELPSAMFEKMGSSLQELHLSNCKNLEMLPEGISVLTSLTEINLSQFASLQFLPQGLGCLSNLQWLNLSGCHKLKGLPYAMFEKMGSSLRELQLSKCKNLEILPQGISVLTSLIELHLSYFDSMDSLPEGIGCLSSLQRLDLRGFHKLKELPKHMFEKMGSSLRELHLSNCKNLEMIPEGISVLTSLTELDLSQLASLEFLPQGLECLSSLQWLNVSGCHKLKGLPYAMFEKMDSSLRELKLSDCMNLEIIPEGISKLTSLIGLHLSYFDSMVSLPKGIGCLSSLHMLDLRSCDKLKELPSVMFEKLGSTLRELHLSNCRNLEMIPEGISVLTSLIEFNMSGCESMDSLPHGIRCLSSLQRLNFSRCNNLKKLPSDMFEKMGNSLLQLILRDCKSLETLPEGISVLTSLTELDLVGCPSLLTNYLPEGMRNLSNLGIEEILS